ncbi:MAG: HAD-IB family phosphatase [Nitrososphaerales archaeon]
MKPSEPRRTLSMVVLSDFDGTIVNVDTGEYLLSKFAHGDWRAYDDQLERGEITLEECLTKQFAMLKETEERLLKEVEGVVSFRPGFEDLVDYCGTEGVPIVVVSGGLDFIITQALRAKNLLDRVEIVAPKANATKRGMTLQFPRLSQVDSLNFKDDLVRAYAIHGIKSIYIGDGVSDFAAIARADIRFAISGSRLTKLCKREGIAFQAVNDFNDVLWNLRHRRA